MEREIAFRREVRSRRNLTYVLWMLSVAFLLISLSFSLGAVFQVIFLCLSIGSFVLSRSISSSLRTR